jgi:hypothetical protein
MKRSADSYDHATKRLVLAVEILSLNSPKISESPSSVVSMEVQQQIESDDSSFLSEWPRHSSSNDSDSEKDNRRRTRSNSEPNEYHLAMDIERKCRDRTWSTSRVVEIQEEARSFVTSTISTVFARRIRSRMLRRASDPPRFREQVEQAAANAFKDTGYSGGCECDSDQEESTLCKTCASRRSGASF